MKKNLILKCISISALLFGNIMTISAEDKDGLHGDGFDTIESDNPNTREMYDSLYREAKYKLKSSSGNVYNATARQGNSFYINGSWTYCGGYAIRELIDTSNQKVNTRSSTTMYSEPFSDDRFVIGSLPKGTYSIVQQSLDFYKVSDGAHQGWIMAESASIAGTKQYLSKDVLQGIKVNKMVPSVGYYIRTGIGMKPKYVTIHNTANEGWGANAKSHANFLYNGESSQNATSWHFTVDNNEIWQSLPMNESGYHAGDGYGLGNTSTIAIEICENADGNYRKAEENAVVLTAYLLMENGLPADAVKMHKDWSGKHCPHNMLDGTKNTMGWDTFMKRVKEVYNSINYAKSIKFKKSVEVVKVDETIQTSVQSVPANSKLGKVSYRTGNPKIATVDSNGKVRGISTGNTYLYAETEDGLSTRVAVKVTSPNVKKIQFTYSSVATTVGRKTANKLILSPTNADESTISYSSSNSKVIYINKEGTYSAVGDGIATITAKAPNGVIAKSIYTVQPAVVTKVKFPIPFKEMNLGQIRSVVATATPNYAKDKSITYSTGNGRIARVDQKGNVSAVGVGNTYLYATSSNGVSTRIAIKVNPIDPFKISFDTSLINMKVEETYNAKVVLYPTYATRGTIIYKTGNSRIATVDEKGIVTAHAIGNTYLYATSENGLQIRVAIDIK